MTESRAPVPRAAGIELLKSGGQLCTAQLSLGIVRPLIKAAAAASVDDASAASAKGPSATKATLLIGGLSELRQQRRPDWPRLAEPQKQTEASREEKKCIYLLRSS